jgi:hypothetical protein
MEISWTCEGEYEPLFVISVSQGIMPTVVLAHSSRPPMGANMIPKAKKSGSTVLGVRIGLSSAVSAYVHDASWISQTHCHAFNRCCVNAVSIAYPSAFHASLHTLYSGKRILAGRLLFSFFFLPFCGSWLSIESVCWISGCSVSVRDILGGVAVCSRTDLCVWTWMWELKDVAVLCAVFVFLSTTMAAASTVIRNLFRHSFTPG